MRIYERDALAFGQALRELLIWVEEPDAAGTGVRESSVKDGVADFINEVDDFFGSHVVRSATGKAASRIRVVIE